MFLVTPSASAQTQCQSALDHGVQQGLTKVMHESHPESQLENVRVAALSIPTGSKENKESLPMDREEETIT